MLRLLVIGLELLTLIDHPLDFVLGQTAFLIGYGDLGGLASALVGRGHIHDAVGVKVKGDLNLGDTSRGRRDAFKVELALEMVVLGHGPLAFVDLDHDTRLVICVGREDLGLLGGDGSVTRDEDSHNTASRLDTEGQGGDIE